ncbi:MAG: hypothetical protein AAGA77_13420 [Bacteroidota bacterium]
MERNGGDGGRGEFHREARRSHRGARRVLMSIGGDGGRGGISPRSMEKSRRCTEDFDEYWRVLRVWIGGDEGRGEFHREARRSQGGARRILMSIGEC